MNLTKRLGAAIGRGWRAYVRIEKRFRAYLTARGANDPLASVGVWTLRALLVASVVCALLLFSTVLYYIASAIVVVAIVWVLVQAARNGGIVLPPPPKPPEWRTDFQGTGLYQHGVRVDPYDPDDPKDSF